MTYETSGLVRDVSSIFAATDGDINHQRYVAIFDTGEEQLEATTVLNIGFLRDYIGNYGDVIRLRVQMPYGLYHQVIFPNRDNLKIILKKIPLMNNSHRVNKALDIISKTYIAIPTDQQFDHFPGASPNNMSLEAASIASLNDFDFELIDPALKLAETRLVNGIFRDSVPGDVLKFILTSEGKKDKTGDEGQIRGVHLIPPDNTDVCSHLIIRNPVSLLGLAEFIQQYGGGLYSTGVNTYLQDGIFYVNPINFYDRVKYEQSTLTIINVPPNKMPGIDKTYTTKGSEVFVISNDNISVQDSSLSTMLQGGNSILYTKAENVIGKWCEYKDGDAICNRKANEVHETLYPLPKDKESTFLPEERFTNNRFKMESQIVKNQGIVATLLWGQSNKDLIRPFMPVRVIYENENQSVYREGVVVGCNTNVVTAGDMMEPRHESTSSLSILMKREG